MLHNTQKINIRTNKYIFFPKCTSFKILLDSAITTNKGATEPFPELHLL